MLRGYFYFESFLIFAIIPNMNSQYKKFTIIFSSLLAVAFAGLWYGNRDRGYSITNDPPAGANIIIFGDSLVEGFGSTEGNDLASILSERIGQPILNAGRGGDTTSSALERLEDDVLTKDPKIVIVLLGGNDYLRRTPKEEIFKNLNTIIGRIQAKGAVVVLVEVRARLIAGGYKGEFKRLAAQRGAILVPDVMRSILGKADLMYDGIHPNDGGYQIMAERIYQGMMRVVE